MNPLGDTALGEAQGQETHLHHMQHLLLKYYSLFPPLIFLIAKRLLPDCAR